MVWKLGILSRSGQGGGAQSKTKQGCMYVTQDSDVHTYITLPTQAYVHACVCVSAFMLPEIFGFPGPEVDSTVN